MSASPLPLYVIIELLIRIAEYNPEVGQYKDHTRRRDGYLIKTTGGTILFTNDLIQMQFTNPDSISRDQLVQLGNSFRSF